MLLESFLSRFQQNKVYKKVEFSDSLSTLIPYSNWCTDGDIAYEITEKKLTALNYLLIKRVCGEDTKNLKFKSKNYLHSKLTTENKEQLASLSESSSNQKLLKWNIKLGSNDNSEKANYQNIKLETKNGKLFELNYQYNGYHQSYIIYYNKLCGSWEIVGNNDDQEISKIKLNSIHFKACNFNYEKSQIKVPETILLIILGHIISYQTQIRNHFEVTKVAILILS